MHTGEKKSLLFNTYGNEICFGVNKKSIELGELNMPVLVMKISG